MVMVTVPVGQQAEASDADAVNTMFKGEQVQPICCATFQLYEVVVAHWKVNRKLLQPPPLQDRTKVSA
jgi:hypothetical protein